MRDDLMRDGLGTGDGEGGGGRNVVWLRAPDEELVFAWGDGAVAVLVDLRESAWGELEGDVLSGAGAQVQAGEAVKGVNGGDGGRWRGDVEFGHLIAGACACIADISLDRKGVACLEGFGRKLYV